MKWGAAGRRPVCVWPGLLPAAAADSVYACFPRGAALLLLLLLLLLRCCCAAAAPLR